MERTAYEHQLLKAYVHCTSPMEISPTASIDMTCCEQVKLSPLLQSLNTNVTNLLQRLPQLLVAMVKERIQVFTQSASKQNRVLKQRQLSTMSATSSLSHEE